MDRKITLLVASFFIVGNMINASENLVFSKNNENIIKTYGFHFDEPISFIERGIEFFVFPNGDFDFNTRPEDNRGNCYYKTAGRRNDNFNRRPNNYGVIIQHDAFGRVRRIGNTFINYDFNDRVNRIGNIYMKYNYFALSQVGGLRIIYNRRGQIIDMIGSVKRYNNYYDNNCENNNYSSNEYYGNGNHYNNDYNSNSNSNEYYYKSNDNNNGNNDYNNSTPNQYDTKPNNSYYYKQNGTKSSAEKENITEKERKNTETDTMVFYPKNRRR